MFYRNNNLNDMTFEIFAGKVLFFRKKSLERHFSVKIKKEIFFKYLFCFGAEDQTRTDMDFSTTPSR